MMDRRILERDHQLAELAEAARMAALGHGSAVLVFGEAGIGKSSMVEAVRSRLPAEGRLLVGYCDDLSTARTLGPFRDLVGAVGSDLTQALRAGSDRERLLAALQAELDWPAHPTVLAIEDVHWADEATLDVLRFLARRIDQLSAVLLLTYRDDELGADHPLRPLLEILARTARTHGLRLEHLSREGVRELSAAHSVDGDAVFAITSGNPFFVSEVLASGDHSGVPGTVLDAVRGRLSRLDPATRDAVEQLAVVPSAIERWLVEALVDGGLPALSGAEDQGLLDVTRERVAFRHELTRRAVADAIPATRSAQLHGDILAALSHHQPPIDVARLVHHAGQAGDAAAIVRHGPVAAAEAVANGSHREALAHYRLVLEHQAAFTVRERAELLEAFAIECYTVGERGRAVTSQQEAVSLRRELGEPAAVGAALRWLSRMQWWNGDRPAAECSAREAIEVLEPVGDVMLLALAYSNQAQLDMLAYRLEAVPVSERAVALAEAAGDPATLSHALNNLGSSRWHIGDPSGRVALERSLRVALTAHEIEHGCRAYVNLAWHLLDQFQIDDAERYVNGGIELAEGGEHLTFLDYLHIERARIELARGQWDDALETASDPVRATVVRCPALVVRGRVHCRRGDRAGLALLETALQLGRDMGEIAWTAPAAAANAEAAWLLQDPAVLSPDALDVHTEAVTRHATALSPELGFWLGKLGRATVSAGTTEEPYTLLGAGRWQDAAATWQAQRCRYEYALALTESGDPDLLLSALAELDDLGAAPLARLTRAELRRLGVARVPRGPAETTRHNPAGLTARQLDVLALLMSGATNAEIAGRLVVSVRTIDNHVAAILQKLDVHTRSAAVIRAGDLGITAVRST